MLAKSLKTAEHKDGHEECSMEEAEAIVFVGRKAVGFYIAKAITELSNSDAVVLVARGQFIVKAVGVAVRLVKAGDYAYKVMIDEEELITDTGRRLVPKIEIEIMKKSREG